MAELITLPSLAMSPMAFSLMASDLCQASRAWLRAAVSCSRDTRDRSSSAWTSEEQVGMRSQERQKKKKGGQQQDPIRTLELLRRALEDTVLLDNFEDGGVSLLLDRR
jgi:hypothetical protein